MVFRGKPSGACLLCRQRRIKCDQQPQGCGSCARAGVACGGYRNTAQLRICDESEPVAKKHSTSKQRKRNKSIPAPRISLASSDVCHLLRPSRDDFAVAVFHIHYEYCQDISTSPCETHAQSPLLDCMKALGLATLGRWEHTPAFEDDMKNYYLSALKQTNAALTSPCCARQNNTLLSVMILSNLETVMSPGQDWREEHSRSFDGWSAHISGSVALLHHRGTHQLMTPYGRLLLMQATTNIISNCFQLAKPVPQPVVDLVDSIEQYIGPHEYEITLHKMMKARLALARIHHFIASKTPFDVQAAIGEVIDLESALGNVSEPIIQEPMPFQDEMSRTSPSLNGSSHLLWEFVASQSRTAMLVIRMTLHLLILKLNRMISSQVTSSCHSTTLQAIKVELLELASLQVGLAREYTLTASTPSSPHIVHRLLLSQAAVSNSAASAADMLLVQTFCDRKCPAEENVSLRLSYGYHIIWALALVGHVDEELRMRAAELLLRAERELGIPQAGILARSFSRHGDEKIEQKF